MNESRIVFFSLVCVGFALSSAGIAQVVQQPPNANPVPPAPPPPPLTIEQRIAQLERELANLQEELIYIGQLRDRGGLNAAIVEQIRNRTPSPRTIDVGVGDRLLLMAKRAKLLSAEEKRTLLPDVIMTVNGIPIREQRLTDMVEYLQSYRPDVTHEELAGQAILALAAGEWPKSHFARFRSEVGQKIRDIHSAATKGADFAGLAKNQSEDRVSGEMGGDLGFIGRDCEYGLNFAMAAFSLQRDGQVSGIVSSPTGLHVLQRTGFEKGDTPDQDQVRISHVMVLHAPVPDEVRQTLNAVVNGRAEIKVRDPELLRMMPKPYR